MLSKKYRLRYLPLFYEDLDEKVTYIFGKLKNPKAANDFGFLTRKYMCMDTLEILR